MGGEVASGAWRSLHLSSFGSMLMYCLLFQCFPHPYVNAPFVLYCSCRANLSRDLGGGSHDDPGFSQRG
jgi:hypothetical protein